MVHWSAAERFLRNPPEHKRRGHPGKGGLLLSKAIFPYRQIRKYNLPRNSSIAEKDKEGRNSTISGYL